MKCSRSVLAVALAAAALAAGPAVGATHVWQGDDLVDPTNWDVAENWADVSDPPDGIGDPPGATDAVNFKGSTGTIIDLMGISRTVGNVRVEAMNDAAVFQSTGGPATLNFADWQIYESRAKTTFNNSLVSSPLGSPTMAISSGGDK